ARARASARRSRLRASTARPRAPALRDTVAPTRLWRTSTRGKRTASSSARQFLLVLVDFRVIGLARQLFLRCAPVLQGLLQERRVQLQPARQLGGDPDVLRHQRELESRVEGAG